MSLTEAQKAKQIAQKYRLDEQIGFVLRRANQRHQAIFAEAIPDLTPTQFAALSKLYEGGPVTQNRLGRLIAMDAATIKGVIDRLRKRGYVETQPDPSDLRRLFVKLSESGRQSYLKHVEVAKHITDRTLKRLSKEEQSELLRLLKQVAQGPEDESK